jgi:hypothetical protein
MATKTTGKTEVRSRGFEFVIDPQPGRTDGRYGVTLAETNGRPEHTRTVGAVPPERLEAARPALVDALSDSGHPATVLSVTRKKPILLDEVAGVRAALALNVITGVSKPGRTTALLDGISRLSDEECFYWYAATIGAGLDTPPGRRRLKALRIFLAQE